MSHSLGRGHYGAYGRGTSFEDLRRRYQPFGPPSQGVSTHNVDMRIMNASRSLEEARRQALDHEEAIEALLQGSSPLPARAERPPVFDTERFLDRVTPGRSAKRALEHDADRVRRDYNKRVTGERLILEGRVPIPQSWQADEITRAAQQQLNQQQLYDQIRDKSRYNTPEYMLGVGQRRFDPLRDSSLRDGAGEPAYWADEVNRLGALSSDLGGARAYDEVMRGGRPAYEVTNDPNVSPFWRKRAYEDTPTKTAQERRDQQQRFQSTYGGHQQRPSFDTLDLKDDRHKAYMARKFKEAGVQNADPANMTEAAYQEALDKKADAYAARRKKRRERVAESVKAPRKRYASEYNRNRGSTSGHLGIDTDDARRQRRMNSMGTQLGNMFSSYPGY